MVWRRFYKKSYRRAVSFLKHIKKILHTAKTVYLKLWSKIVSPIPKFFKTGKFLLSLGAILVFIMVMVVRVELKNATYELSSLESSLLTKPSGDKSKIEDTKTEIIYNKPSGSKIDKPISETVIAGDADATGNFPYSAKLSKSAKDGVTISDSKGELNFTMTSIESLSDGKLVGETVVYPASSNEVQVYTFKRSGIKQDIIFSKKPNTKVITRSWKLDGGNMLEAKLLTDGSVGVYSASPYLYGNITASAESDKALLEKAKTNGPKTYLQYIIPRPYMIDGRGVKNYDDVSYSLKDNVLSLEARNMFNQQYPLTIDPTIVVTTTAELQTGSTTGAGDFDTSGQITVASDLVYGNLDEFTAGTSFTNPRYNHASIAYNGYLYVLGGFNGRDYYNDVQYATINSSTGSISAFSSTTSFPISRSAHTAVAYNGYMYIVGGESGSGNYLNDVLYAPINSSTGAIGSWSNSTNTLATGRSGHGSVAYNGFLYVLGGEHATEDTACHVSASIYCSDVKYAPINSDGSTGVWSSANSLSSARSRFGVVIYNDILHVIGGYNGSYLADSQHAVINTNGTTKAWQTDVSFNTARYGHSVGVYRGFLYIVGGCSADLGGVCTTFRSDIQFFQIGAGGSLNNVSTNTISLGTARTGQTSLFYGNYLYVIGGLQSVNNTACNASASFTCSDVNYAKNLGSLAATGAATTNSTYMTTPRYGHAAVVYNGFLYITGGCIAGSSGSCASGSTGYESDTQYAKIQSNGTLSSFTTDGSTFTTPGRRVFHTMVAYNNYLYIIGGQRSAASTSCKNTGVSSIFCNDVLRSTIAQNGTIGGWSTIANFTTPRFGHDSFVYNGRIYVTGGCSAGTSSTCTTMLSDVQYALISDDGSVGTFSATTSFTTARYWHSTVQHNGYMYIMGGCQAGSSCTTVLADIQYAKIGPTGALTTGFSNPVSGGGNIGTARAQAGAAVVNNGLYIVGGCIAYTSGTQSCTSYSSTTALFASIKADGTLSTFSNSFSIPSARYGAAVVEGGGNNMLYTTGGFRASTSGCKNTGLTSSYCSDIIYRNIPAFSNSNTAFNNADTGTTPIFGSYTTMVAYKGYLYVGEGSRVKYAAIAADGTLGSFTNGPNFIKPHDWSHNLLIYNDYIYVMGGDDTNNSVALNTGEYAKINTNGSIGSWTTTTAFTTSRDLAATAAYNGYLYVAGGTNYAATSTYSTVYYALICTGSNSGVGGCTSAVGSLGTFTSTTSLPTARYSPGLVPYNGRMYLVGGAKQSITTSCTDIDYGSDYDCTDIQYAPINSDGSLGSWVLVGRVANGADPTYAFIYNDFLYKYGINSSGMEIMPIFTNGTVGTARRPQLGVVGSGQNGLAFYDGFVYYYNSTAQRIIYAQLDNAKPKLTYERVIDTTFVSNFTSFRVTSSNTNNCGNNDMTISYKSAGSDGVYGSATTISNATAGTTNALNLTSKRYLWVSISLDDSICGGVSTINDITLTYTNTAPAAPTLIYPTASLTNVAVLPRFVFGTTDDAGDYVQYYIDVCSNSTCTTYTRQGIDQSTSQTGWQGQNAQSGTAYTAGISSITQYASHTYQAPALSPGTVYRWRVRARDPGGSNTYGSFSAIGTFTTATPANQNSVNMRGGLDIKGGTNIR
jgi:hypothetical protein